MICKIVALGGKCQREREMVPFISSWWLHELNDKWHFRIGVTKECRVSSCGGYLQAATFNLDEINTVLRWIVLLRSNV